MSEMGKAARVCVGGAAQKRAFTLLMISTLLVTKESGQNLLVCSVRGWGGKPNRRREK